MYCNKCGNQLNEPSKFCPRCGNPLGSEISNNLNVSESKNKMVSASVAIGALSLTLVFIFQIFTIPLSIIGIILGAIGFSKTKQKTGLILNSVSCLLAVPILLIYIFILNPANDLIGTWNCKYFNNGEFEKIDYVITIKLDRYNSFFWNIYGESETNYLKGIYNVKKLNKRVNGAEYYSLVLDGNEYVVDGVLQDGIKKAEYEMALNTESGDEAFLMNAYSYNMYVCFKE